MLRFAPSSSLFGSVVIVEFSITTKVSCDCSCIVVDILDVKEASRVEKVTSGAIVVCPVCVKVGIHVTEVIDIVPAWLFLWKFNISCSLLTFVDPLISSVEAVFEHALLTKDDG